MDRHLAIRNTHPSVVTINGDTDAFDQADNPITLDQTLITAEILRLQTEYDNNQYARDRKARYDSLNQFEMQYDDAVNGTTTWQDAINAIKQEIPKGGN